MHLAVHTLIYSDDADATRAFLRGVLGWPFVAEERDSGWLIFRTGPSELGVHPATGADGQQWATPPHHEVCLVVDDIAQTVIDLRAKGAAITDPEDMGFGVGSSLTVPGAGRILVYQATHETAYDLTD